MIKLFLEYLICYAQPIILGVSCCALLIYLELKNDQSNL